jgi:hypothetical protein
LHFNVEAKKEKKASPINHIHEIRTTVNSVSNIEPPYSTGEFFQPRNSCRQRKDDPFFVTLMVKPFRYLIDDQKFNFAEMLPELTL